LPPQRLPGRRSRRRLNHKEPKRSPCRLATTRQAPLQLQHAQQLRPCVAKNASGDTRRHATELGAGRGQPQEAQPQQAQPKILSPRRLATTRQATSQLQPAQQLRPCVAKNASGDTKRHATQSAPPLAAAGLPTKPTAPEAANKTALALLANMAHSPKPGPAPVGCAACAGCRFIVVGNGVDAGATYCFWLRDRCVPCRKHLDSIPPNTEVAVARRERGAVRTL
jgi:hypothetical protein